jgi:hypothetical protein
MKKENQWYSQALYFGGEEGSEAWSVRPSDERKPNMKMNILR